MGRKKGQSINRIRATAFTKSLRQKSVRDGANYLQYDPQLTFTRQCDGKLQMPCFETIAHFLETKLRIKCQPGHAN